MRDGSPETEGSEWLHVRGSHAPAPPFAQRLIGITDGSSRAKSPNNCELVIVAQGVVALRGTCRPDL